MALDEAILARNIDNELIEAGVESGPFKSLRKKIVLAFAKGIVKSLSRLEIEGEIESLMTDSAGPTSPDAPMGAHRHQIRKIKLTGLRIK